MKNASDFLLLEVIIKTISPELLRRGPSQTYLIETEKIVNC